MTKAWFEVDPKGLRKTLSQKNKFFLIAELVSNGWDEEDHGATRLDVTLTRPDDDGFSILTATDNSPRGFHDISHAYVMFAESEKKDQVGKRGRFNAGEKDAISMAVEAHLTTTTGQIFWNADGTRTEGTETREVGSELRLKIQLLPEEFDHISARVLSLLPPNKVATYFNGERVQSRRPAGIFTTTLPTPIADREGYVRNLDRDTKVKLFTPHPGQTTWIYEMGIPIVELEDDAWHIDIQQKVPLSRDRDNVPPSYLRKVRAAVLNAKYDELTQSETESNWVVQAAGAPEAKDEAIKGVLTTRFEGKEIVLDDRKDPGAKHEATSKGAVVLTSTFTGGLRARAKELKKDDGTPFIPLASEKYPTTGKVDTGKIIPPEQWSLSVRQYVELIQRVAPQLVSQRVVVRIIDDESAPLQGCLQWQSGIMTVNVAHHDTEDEQENLELLLHEMAHTVEHSNNHLKDSFYLTVESLGAKLVQLALEDPALLEKSEAAKCG
jgi:hypothetical protein